MEERKSWGWVDASIIVGIAALTVLVTGGFFFPDPIYYSGTAAGGLKILLLLLKGGTIALGVLMLALYVGYKLGRLPVAGLAILTGGMFFSILLCYPVATYFYYDRNAANPAKSYHPYLQLAPLSYQPRASEGVEKPYKIFCLGGSTTEWKSTREEDWQSLTEAELKRTFDRKNVQIHNLGREWYTSLHSLINYTTNLKHHKPDAIIVMHALNDLLHNADFSYFSSGPFQDDYRHFYGPVSRIMMRKSMFGTISEKLSAAWYHQPREIIETADFPGLVPFSRNLRNIIALARSEGTKVILMTEPNLYKELMTQDEIELLYMLHREAVGPRYQWSLATARTGMELYNETIRNIARQENVALIDLDRLVPKTTQYFNDDVHYKDDAYPLIAKTLAKELVERNLIAVGHKSLKAP